MRAVTYGSSATTKKPNKRFSLTSYKTHIRFTNDNNAQDFSKIKKPDLIRFTLVAAVAAYKTKNYSLK